MLFWVDSQTFLRILQEKKIKSTTSIFKDFFSKKITSKDQSNISYFKRYIKNQENNQKNKLKQTQSTLIQNQSLKIFYLNLQKKVIQNNNTKLIKKQHLKKEIVSNKKTNKNSEQKQKKDVNKLLLELKPTITIQQAINTRQRIRQDTQYIEHIKNMLKLQIDKRLVIGGDIFIERQVTSIIHASNVQFRNDINRQVQQLHEEEMELLRVQHAEEILTLKEEVKRLEGDLNRMSEQMKVMEKNSKHHACQLMNDSNQSFLIQNIDMINCANIENDQDKQEQLSRLDQSQVCQFYQLIVQGKTETINMVVCEDNNNNNFALLSIPKSQRSINNLSQQPQLIVHQQILKNQSQQQVVGIKNYQPQYAHHHKDIGNNNNNNNNNDPTIITLLHQQQQIKLLHQQQQITLLHQQQQTVTQQLNTRILQLQSQIQSLFETNQQLTKQCKKLQISQKSIKNNYQSLYKQSKFMADHIRTLANDKFKLQRRVKQLEKEIRDVNVKGLKKSFTLGEDNSNSNNNNIINNNINKDNNSNKSRNVNNVNSSNVSNVNSSNVSNNSSVRFSKVNDNSKFDNNNSNIIINNHNNNNDHKLSNKNNNINKYNQLFVSSEGFDNVNTSRQNSIDSKSMQDKHSINKQQLYHVPIMKVISIENFNKSNSNINNNDKNDNSKKQADIPFNALTQSQFLQVNNRQFDSRKSMPSYKKVSHISPSPSFKKPSLKNTKEKSPQFLKLMSSSSQLKQDDFDKSDFMDQIRKEIQKKSAIKKITVNDDHHQGLRPSSLFNDMIKKRSNTKN